MLWALVGEKLGFLWFVLRQPPSLAAFPTSSAKESLLEWVVTGSVSVQVLLDFSAKAQGSGQFGKSE